MPHISYKIKSEISSSNLSRNAETRSSQDKSKRNAAVTSRVFPVFGTLPLCEWSKDIIHHNPTMNIMCYKICAVTSLFFSGYMALILKFQLTNMPTNSIPLNKLQTVTTTVFFTFCALFAFLRFLSTNHAQKTTLMFGMLTAFFMGVSHLVELVGLRPCIETFNDRCVCLVQNGEYIVCLPLMLCAFGHVFKIQERVVLSGAGLQALASVALCVASISTSKALIFICGICCVMLLIPVVVVIFTISFQTDGPSRATQVLEIQLYGCACTLVYIVFGGFYLNNALGVVSVEWEQIGLVCFDLVWVLFLFAVLFGSQLRLDAERIAVKVTGLESANAAQKSFLRFVFHEVRVPFHSLFLGIEHLATQPDLAVHQSLLAMLMQSAEMMHRTINDVLLLSRLEDRKLQLEVAPFSVSEMVKSVLQTFQPLANEKKIKLTSQIDPAFPRLLLGDQHRISEIIANLISNGVKFSKEGQVLDTCVNVLNQPFDACYFELKVQDEGIGMTTEDQKLLFMPFSQIRPSQNQSGKGSGLGLSIVKHIVELHQGTISVSSELGKGSTFFVRMKLPIFNSNDRDREQSGPEVVQNMCNNSSEIKPYMSDHNSAPTSMPPMLDCKAMSEQTSSSSVGKEAQLSKQKSNKILPCDLSCQQTLERAVAAEGSKKERFSRTLAAPIQVWTSAKNSGPPSSKSDSSRRTPSSITDSPMKVLTFFSQSLDRKQARAREITLETEELIREVLVVDDSSMNRKLTRLILEQQGFTVAEACNGLEAVQMARERKYWAIFMDNQMPVMNGVEATRRITEACSCVVIGLTGNSLDEDVSEFLQAGARDVLIKPCKKEQMLEVLSKLDNIVED